MRATWLTSAALACALFGAHAETNIDPDHAIVSSDWIGALNWAPGDSSGAVINQYYCSGYIYGANVGWIALSSGIPSDLFHFKNNSAQDFGVNVLPGGALRGFAYGANIGWVNFEETGNPRVDWNTGKLSGSAWSANAGWIPLEDGVQNLQIAFLAESLDSDNDGLPDAWEMEMAGNLAALSGEADTDGDGQTDLDEYLAGTQPLDPADFLGPIHLTVTSGNQQISWPGKAGYVYRVEARSRFGGSDSWAPVDSTPLIGDGAPMHLDLPSSAETQLFFRVRAYPPLSTP